MQTQLFCCDKKLTSLWHSTGMNAQIGFDNEQFNLVELWLDIANIVTTVSYQVRSPFSFVCCILSSAMRNSNYNREKYRTRTKHTMRHSAQKSSPIFNSLKIRDLVRPVSYLCWLAYDRFFWCPILFRKDNNQSLSVDPLYAVWHLIDVHYTHAAHSLAM